jgi:phosphoribosylamine--glycine ligase
MKINTPINVLLLGGGGREHALAWGISHSEHLGTLYMAPGNPGMSHLGESLTLDINNHEAVVDCCKDLGINLVVVGPEQPLVDGLADVLRNHKIAVFGPSKEAARLEGSKSFAKAMMAKFDVPTAAYASFTADKIDEAKSYLKSQNTYPIVLKADGLAAGKGVIIAETEESAFEALKAIASDKKFGEAGNSLVIEAFMEGEEVSVFVLSDGKSFMTLGNAQDHKRIGEGDTGLNTGGMGAYSPAPILTDDLEDQIDDEIVAPMLFGLAEEGMPYVGVLYVGLMLTKEGPKVVEFNCRFGDPECQVLIPSIQSDVLELLYATATEKLSEVELLLDDAHRCTVVLASAGYPESYEKGKAISGLQNLKDDTLVFHSGTKIVDDVLVTNGGRVLNVVQSGESLQKALDKAYADIENIRFEGKYFRKDIGKKGLAHYKK